MVICKDPVTGGIKGKSAPLHTMGRCYGTFGELLQGSLPDQRHFLVTLPIDIESVIAFEALEQPQVTSSLTDRTKACRAVEYYLKNNRLPLGGKIHFHAMFPTGQGLASSSADMVAAVRAAANAYDHRVTPGEIESILRQIEPTDGVMYDGIVSFYHKEVQLDERLGATPAMVIVGAAREGACDTVLFNNQPHPITKALQYEYRDLLDEMKKALHDRRLKAVGAISTRSCELSQAFNPMPYLNVMQSIQAETDALGLVAAHSGTYIGLLYDMQDPEWLSKSDAAQRMLRAQRIPTHTYKTV